MSALAAPGASSSDADPAKDPVMAVTALLLFERQSRDRERWAKMAGCYAPDATIAMSWFKGLAADFVEQSRSMNVSGSRGVHRLSPPVVRMYGHRAIAELPLVIEFRTDVEGVEADLCSFARSQYRAVLVDGSWRISAITSVYERDTLTAAVPGTVLPVAVDALARLRPSYRCLAWHLGRSGYEIPDDLPGDDRPHTVAEVMAKEQAWLTETHPRVSPP